MHQAFLDVNGVRTDVVTYGRWVEEAPAEKGPEDIILVIPGNPGVIGFYKLFLHILHEQTGRPVWMVAHAGHENPKRTVVLPNPGLKGNEELYGLRGQIEHKAKFIEDYVPANARLHLIGHSVGSFMILELMKIPSIESRVKSVNLLFPTIERMAGSDNGKFMTNLIKPIVRIVLFLSLIFTVLPRMVQNFLVYLYTKVVAVPRMHIGTIVDFVHPSVLRKVFFLAWEEFEQCEKRNDDVIKRHLDKIKLVYGAEDGWAPASYCEELKRDIPEIDAVTTNFHHAFVLRQSKQVGTFIADRLNGI